MHRAFTLIELLIVLVVIGILTSMIFVGLRDALIWAQLYRTANRFVQATETAKVMAAANGRVYQLVFNSAKNVPIDVNLGTYYGAAAAAHGRWAPAPQYYSEAPEDQWFAVMGPWQDKDGNWWPAVGGMPVYNATEANGTVWNGYPKWYSGAVSNRDTRRGGLFGHPLDAAGRLPAGQHTSTTPWSPSTAVWDPYEIQVGKRMFLEPATRYMIRPDNPEWAYLDSNATPNQGRNYSYLQAGFHLTPYAPVTVGRPNATNEHERIFNFNFYPNGMIDRGMPTGGAAYFPCGAAFDQTQRGFVGFVSRRTKPATYIQATDADNGRVYNRPLAQLFVTLWRSGEIIIDRSPALVQ